MKVLVCGSRHFDDKRKMEEILGAIPGIDRIIHGGARGADTLAGEYAEAHDIEVDRYMAEWERYGKRAGYLRNQRMLTEGRPDLVVAFLFHVGVQETLYGLSNSQYNRGTKNMIKIAQEAGIETWVVDLGFKVVGIDENREAVVRKLIEEEKEKERRIMEKVIDDFIPRRIALESSRKAVDAFK